MTDLPDTSASAGMAALSIVESLLIVLGDLKILSAKDVEDLLLSVAETHRNAAELATGAEADLHRKVAAHADRIIAGGNSGFTSNRRLNRVPDKFD